MSQAHFRRQRLVLRVLDDVGLITSNHHVAILNRFHFVCTNLRQVDAWNFAGADFKAFGDVAGALKPFQRELVDDGTIEKAMRIQLLHDAVRRPRPHRRFEKTFSHVQLKVAVADAARNFRGDIRVVRNPRSM